MTPVVIVTALEKYRGMAAQGGVTRYCRKMRSR